MHLSTEAASERVLQAIYPRFAIQQSPLLTVVAARERREDAFRPLASSLYSLTEAGWSERARRQRALASVVQERPEEEEEASSEGFARTPASSVEEKGGKKLVLVQPTRGKSFRVSGPKFAPVRRQQNCKVTRRADLVRETSRAQFATHSSLGRLECIYPSQQNRGGSQNSQRVPPTELSLGKSSPI